MKEDMVIPLCTQCPKTFPIAFTRQETAHVQTFVFDVTFGAKPGQFLMVWLPGVDEIPMSVAMDDGQRTSVTFFAVGDMSRRLAECRVGDLVGLRGPFGTFYQWERGQHIVLVAGGYGAAPMYFVASETVHHGCTLEVIVGAKSKDHLLFLHELESLPHVSLHVATDDGSMGFRGYNVQLLEKLLKVTQDPETDDVAVDQVFACGPEMMLKAISKITATYDIPSQISLERYMKCGFGICGNCTVDPLGIPLCTQGPVVKNDICINIEEFGVYHRNAVGRKHFFNND